MVRQPVRGELRHQLSRLGEQAAQGGVGAGRLQHGVGQGLAGVVAQVDRGQVHDVVHRHLEVRLPWGGPFQQLEPVGQRFLRQLQGILVGEGGVHRGHLARGGGGGGHPGLEGRRLPHPLVLEPALIVLDFHQEGADLPQAAVVGEDQVHRVPVLAFPGSEGAVKSGLFRGGRLPGEHPPQQAQGQ